MNKIDIDMFFQNVSKRKNRDINIQIFPLINEYTSLVVVLTDIELNFSQSNQKIIQINMEE